MSWIQIIVSSFFSCLITFAWKLDIVVATPDAVLLFYLVHNLLLRFKLWPVLPLWYAAADVYIHDSKIMENSVQSMGQRFHETDRLVSCYWTSSGMFTVVRSLHHIHWTLRRLLSYLRKAAFKEMEITLLIFKCAAICWKTKLAFKWLFFSFKIYDISIWEETA